MTRFLCEKIVADYEFYHLDSQRWFPRVKNSLEKRNVLSQYYYQAKDLLQNFSIEKRDDFLKRILEEYVHLADIKDIFKKRDDEAFGFFKKIYYKRKTRKYYKKLLFLDPYVVQVISIKEILARIN